MHRLCGSTGHRDSAECRRNLQLDASMISLTCSYTSSWRELQAFANEAGKVHQQCDSQLPNDTPVTGNLPDLKSAFAVHCFQHFWWLPVPGTMAEVVGAFAASLDAGMAKSSWHYACCMPLLLQ